MEKDTRFILTANKITNEIKSKSGKVTNIIKNVNQIIPPFPFNTTELQKEASRILKFNKNMFIIR